MHTASSAKSPDALFSALNASGLPDTPDAHQFISEVYTRAPRKGKHKKDSARKQAEQEAKALRAQKFDFLLDDDVGQSSSVVEVSSKEKSQSGKKERHTRKRESDAREWEDDEEEKARKRMRPDEDHHRRDDDRDDEELMNVEEEEDEETRRLRDLEERDAFAERVKQKDREKTKKIVEDRSSKNSGAAAEAAERRRLADDADARQRAMPNLREHSRQEYLTKREIQRIELLRREIADDESLFRGMKVTKREQQDLERKKELLRLVEERLKIDDKYEGYMLPEDYLTEQGKIDKKKKENVLYKRYEEAKPKDDQFTTDVDQWEAAQTRHSTFKVGAMDKPELVEEYEYVFDESQTIKFVMDATMGGEGTMSAADKLLQQQIDEAEKRGQHCHATQLPLLLTSELITQRHQSRKLVTPFLYTDIANNSLMLSKNTRSSSLSPRPVQARPPNYLNTCTKQATLPVA